MHVNDKDNPYYFCLLKDVQNNLFQKVVTVSEIAITSLADVTCTLHVTVNDDDKLSLDHRVANKVPKVSFTEFNNKRMYLLSTL